MEQKQKEEEEKASTEARDSGEARFQGCTPRHIAMGGGGANHGVVDVTKSCYAEARVRISRPTDVACFVHLSPRT